MILHTSKFIKHIQFSSSLAHNLFKRQLYPFTNTQQESEKPKNPQFKWWVKYAIGVPLISGIGLYQYTKYRFLKYVVPEEDEPQPKIYDEVKVSSRIVRLIKYILRFIQLSLIFLPSIITLPFAAFPSTLDYWLSTFLWSIQNAGVVWIKAFQYLSHRRDVIGPELAEKFACLRDNSPTHSQKETQKIFKRVYGVNIDQMFDQFDFKPIASGSISQVYKAKFEGKKVALKVRHPNVQKNIQRDIQILFFFSKIFSKISKKFEIPINNQSMKKILIDQIYFTRESQNLKKFRRIFINPDVKFPQPLEQTNDEVLVQTFAEGLPVSFYIDHPHKLNRAIAMLGASTIFQMLMRHNFIHADCHGGNIFVKIEPNTNWYRPFQDKFKNIQNWIIARVIKFSFDSPLLQKLAQQNYEYEKSVHEMLEKSRSKVQFNILDVGMVVNLNEGKKKTFGDLLKEIVKGNPQSCASIIYDISLKGKQEIKYSKTVYQRYLKDLEKMFQIVNTTNLNDLQGIDILNGMLRVVRKHNMKLDGEISILLTNLLVLQAMAKDLDPQINVFRCAIPFLVHRGLEEIKEKQLQEIQKLRGKQGKRLQSQNAFSID